MTATAVRSKHSDTGSGRYSLSRWDCLSGPFTRGGICVRPKRSCDIVVARFTPGHWRNIFSDIDSDIALNRYLASEKDTCKAFILERPDASEPFGWILIRRHDDVLCDSIEFHGGAWHQGFGSSTAKFLASCIVIDAALCMGVRVTSRVYRRNISALRFLEGIGFKVVNRSSSRPWLSLTLSRRRFCSSAVVKRLFLNE